MRLYAALIFVLGVGAGIAASLMLIPSGGNEISWTQLPSTASTTTSDADYVKSLQSALKEAEAALSAEIAKVAELEDQLASAKTTVVAEAPPPEDPAAMDAERLEQMRVRIENRMGRRNERLLTAYVRVANLRPDQVERLAALMDAQTANRITQMEARMNGEDIPIDSEADLRAQLASVLDPTQLAAIDEYEADIERGRIETRATAMTNNISPNLGLSQEQEDAVYSAYYYSMDGTTNGASDLNAEMQSILTPEQYATWQEMQSEGRGRGGPGGFDRPF
jgi:hypothetical protein